MNKLAAATIAAATSLFAAVPSSQAGTLEETFDVKVTLTSQCRMATDSPAAPELQFGNYTAFSATHNAPTTFIKFECTRGLASAAFDIDGTPLVDGTPIYGVIAGLNYSVTPTIKAKADGTPAAASAGSVGTGDIYQIDLVGAMPDNQAGTAVAGEQSITHHLTITY